MAESLSQHPTREREQMTNATEVAAEQQIANLTDGEVLASGRWPAWFTIDQCRAQLIHEAKGCPPPFPGAVWDGYSYSLPKRQWLHDLEHEEAGLAYLAEREAKAVQS